MNNSVTVYGASDHLIEIEGCITEEFSTYGCDDQVLAFSDGTVLSVRYTDDGCWEFRRVEVGTATFFHQTHDNDRTTYTDRVKLTGDDLRWCVFGELALTRPTTPTRGSDE